MARPVDAILCFSSFSKHDELMNILEYSSCENRIQLDGFVPPLRVDRYVSRHNANRFIDTHTIRRPSWQERMEEVVFFARQYSHVFIFGVDVPDMDISQACNPNAEALEQALGIAPLSEAQRALYATFLESLPRAQQRPTDDFIRILLPFDLEVIFNPAATHQEDEQQAVQRALEQSAREDEARREAQSKIRTRLQEGWADILKKSEPRKKGYPACICCLESMATICLVDCGCVVLCDDCVREIWTRSRLKRVCPACQQPCTMITRIRMSELATSDAEEEEEEPSSSKKLKL